MATTIKATCFACGEIDLTPLDLTVTVADGLNWSTYQFMCPKCTDICVKVADPEVVRLLERAGVRIERIHVPLEVVESQQLIRTLGSLTRDELLDFAIWLESAPVDSVLAEASRDRQ